MKPVLLILSFLTDAHRQQLAQSFPDHDLVYEADASLRDAVVAEHGQRVQTVLTVGATGLSAENMQAMPALGLVCALGAGYENVDVAHARAHGIAVGYGVATNDDCVADHALALMLAAVRGVVRLDQATRQGVWRTALPLPAQLSRKRLGILGMGTIGAKIAQRALGFDMQVAYHNRKPRPGVQHAYFDSLQGLAEWADVLLVATPGGAGTRHLVNAQVLSALGPKAYLINIARGTVVDTEALAQALRTGGLAGAGLDVYESEPLPPAQLLDLDTVVLTPHVAGWSPEAVQASVDRFIANMQRHLAGQELVSPVP